MATLSRDQVLAGLELLTDPEHRAVRATSTVLAVRMAEERAAYHAMVFRRGQLGQPRPEGETPLCKCGRCIGA
ncbi:hypothetical protein B0G71_2568 [Paraburkholderia sp. BL27I4N3]|nr:hypothetical protein B0G71_2568 [Paraburkholderia sp. BL27I4N3]